MVSAVRIIACVRLYLCVEVESDCRCQRRAGCCNVGDSNLSEGDNKSLFQTGICNTAGVDLLK